MDCQLILIAPFVSLLCTAILQKQWQRLVALAVTVLLALPLGQLLGGELQKADWAATSNDICRPVQSMFDQLSAEVRANDFSRASAHLTFLATNWSKVAPHPWMKKGDWLIQEWEKQSKQGADAKSLDAGQSPPKTNQ